MSLKNKIQTEINQAIEAELFPGAAIGYILPGGKQEVVVGGHYTTSESSPIVTADSIYDLASITKSIPTASLALYLIDRGELSLDDKVIYFLPQLTGEFMDEITVRHLLRFEIEYGFSLSKNKDKSAEEILEIIFTTDLPTPPGTQYVYTNAAAVLLGLVVEKVAGEGLDKLAEKIFFKPLGMSRTRFRPLEKFTTEEIAPSEIDVWRGKALRGEVHDESAYVLSSIIAPGSAGLFSTTSDLLKFMQMLLLGGEFAGRN
ncbi:MAG: serine hydrolase domain-containing protein, partial [bacterium]